MASNKVVRFSVNFIGLETPSKFLSSELKIWYSMGYPHTTVFIDNSGKINVLLDSGAEVNVMTCKVMAAAGLAMRQGPCFELVTYLGQHRPFWRLQRCCYLCWRLDHLIPNICCRTWQSFVGF